MRRGRLFVEWLLIGLGASLVLLSSIGGSLFDRADRLLYDMVAPLHAAPADDRLLIVAIDDDTLAATGRWPWPRDIHARALTAMKAARPDAILYDILFIEPSAQDRQLAEAMAGQPPVFLPMLFDIPGPDGAPWLIHRPVSPIAEAAGGIGTANLSLDRDGRARSIAIATGEDGTADRRQDDAPMLPHMAELGYRHLAGHLSPAFQRTAATGEALHIPFLPPGSFRTISLLPILRGEVPADFLRGKILLVGATAEGLGDIHPVSTAHAGRLPGVEVQANLLSSLLADRFVTPLPPVAVAALSLLPLWALMLIFWRLSPSQSLLFSIGTTIALVVGSVAALAIGGWWFPPVAALTGIILVYPLWGWRRLAAVTQFMGDEVRTLLTGTGIGEPAPSPSDGWRGDRVASDAGRLHQVLAIMQRNAREREEMLQFLSHDMRSPQASIIALLEGRQDTLSDPALSRQIRRHAERTLRLADDFVQLARLQSRPRVEEAVDIRDAMAQAGDMIWARAKARHITIRHDDRNAAAAPDLWVAGDAEALVRAFANLLGNAVEASPEGTTISCSVRQEGDQVIASVADQGPGLPPDRRDDPFARFGYSEAAGKGGSGLGLSYVATVAEQHGGSADYADRPGGGACFSLRLPLMPDEEAE